MFFAILSVLKEIRLMSPFNLLILLIDKSNILNDYNLLIPLITYIELFAK